MKLLLRLLPVLALLLTTQFLSAQSSTLRHGLTAKRLFVDYYSPHIGEFGDFTDDYTDGAEIGYIYNLNSFLNLNVPVKIGTVRIPLTETTFSSTRFFWSAGLNLQIKYFKEDFWISPYLLGGAGVHQNENFDAAVHFPVGGGFNFKLANHLYLQIQTERRFSLEDNDDHYHHGIGFMMLIGKYREKEKTPEEPPVIDSDGDGLADGEDKCPTEAGIAALGGCPDKDNDGIIDKEDECPEVAGTAPFNGCPDSDGDGLADPQDDCPQEAGPLANKGCPLADADGDGVPDEQDQCPDAAGPLAGCPDSDGDGVADPNDNCIDAAGPASLNGCPDSDGDGVADVNDRCPTSAGTAANFGCPEIQEKEKEVLNLAMQAIQFETARATLKNESYTILDQIADILRKYPDYNVSIEGHTDSIGDSASNKRLSGKRAEACYKYLQLKGIDASRMQFIGYGEERPIANNKYKDGRKLNRRVEFNIYLR
ncbi:MAG: OmpA family protein [Bacteroidota bacterium]